MISRGHDSGPLLLHDMVFLASESYPSGTAIVMGSHRLSYGELEQHSNRLARLLGEHGVRTGDRVCLLLPKGIAAVVSMLATLKAGGVYVPVDIASPAARVQMIISAAEPRLVLSCAAASRLISELELGAAQLGAVEGELEAAAFGPEAADGLDEGPLTRSGRPHDPAHILFTSGSTGTPKGVVITHAMVGAFLDWALPYFGHRPGDRVSAHPPLHFDLSTFDIYGTLSSGGELHLVPANVILPKQLASFIRDAELTQWFSVPSTFAYMVRGNAIDQDDFPSLQRVIWCGEVLAPGVLAHWMARVPQASYTNLYGPTETTIASSFHTVVTPPSDPAVPIPIGKPCSGEEILVLDAELRPVRAGEPGELCIAGAGLSPGYWRDPEKTARAFVSMPGSERRIYRTGDLGREDADGVLHYIGRADSQIKSRGYRIELGEIETAANSVENVAECAIVAVPSDGFEGTAICCAWATRPGAELDNMRLRRELASILPSYMLPSRWLPLEELPKNASGKIDRVALKRRFEQTESDA